MEQTFTAKLIPSSYTLSPSGSSKFYITNADNIYSDTSSNEYATIYNNYGSAYSGSIDLHFDLTELEHFEEASSVNSFSLSIKVGNCYNASNLDWIVPFVENDGTEYSPEYSEYSHTTPWGLNPDATGKSITSVNTSAIEPHLIGASDLWITVDCKQSSNNYTNYLYICGAELNITYTITKNYNKFVYGNETLIDLTGDTATASDVRTGVIFHLASGVQTTGTMTPTMSTKSKTTESGYDTTNISIYGLVKEPSWFILICASADDGIEDKVLHIIYDGSSITERNAGSASVGMVFTTPVSGTPTVAYSNGRLDIDHYADPYYFGGGEWELFYM